MATPLPQSQSSTSDAGGYVPNETQRTDLPAHPAAPAGQVACESLNPSAVLNGVKWHLDNFDPKSAYRGRVFRAIGQIVTGRNGQCYLKIEEEGTGRRWFYFFPVSEAVAGNYDHVVSTNEGPDGVLELSYEDKQLALIRKKYQRDLTAWANKTALYVHAQKCGAVDFTASVALQREAHDILFIEQVRAGINDGSIGIAWNKGIADGKARFQRDGCAYFPDNPEVVLNMRNATQLYLY